MQHIAIIEDETIVRESLSSLVMLWSNCAEIPKSKLHLHESVESFLLKKQTMNFIISDIFLKQQQNGLSLLTGLRSRNDPTPVILISALDSQQITPQISHFKDTYFVQKPFNPQQILNLLKKGMVCS